MQRGSRELTRAATAYLTCLSFALTFLVSVLTGAAGVTPLVRGVIVAVAVWFVGGLLMRPLLSTVLDAMARDRATVAEGSGENAE